MKHIIILLGLCLPITLQEAYDQAEAYDGYEKYLVLEPDQIYTGGIGIYEGDVYINCRGSIIDLNYQNRSRTTGLQTVQAQIRALPRRRGSQSASSFLNSNIWRAQSLKTSFYVNHHFSEGTVVATTIPVHYM